MFSFPNMAHNSLHCTTLFFLQFRDSINNFVLFATTDHNLCTIMSKLFSNGKPNPKKMLRNYSHYKAKIKLQVTCADL